MKSDEGLVALNKVMKVLWHSTACTRLILAKKYFVGVKALFQMTLQIAKGRGKKQQFS